VAKKHICGGGRASKHYLSNILVFNRRCNDRANAWIIQDEEVKRPNPTIVVSVPKIAQPANVNRYRPISLLNSDTKIISRCFAERLSLHMEKLLGNLQFAAIKCKSIFELLLTIRDCITISNGCNLSTAFVNLDFQNAFNNINHSYLWQVLQRFGFSKRYIKWIKYLYKDAITKLNIVI